MPIRAIVAAGCIAIALWLLALWAFTPTGRQRPTLDVRSIGIAVGITSTTVAARTERQRR